MDQKILDKIKKCLALSTSPEPGEAANALRQAQKLMEMHGVSELHLKLADVGEVHVKSTASVSKPKPYEVILVNTVAKAFGCVAMVAASNSYATDVFATFTLIGLKSQVQIAEYTLTVVLRKHMKAQAEFVRSLPDIGRAAKIREADGFSRGWADTISKTVQAFAQPEETKDLINQFKDHKYGVTKHAAVQARKIGNFGWAAGRDAASNESITRPVNGTSNEMKRLHHG